MFYPMQVILNVAQAVLVQCFVHHSGHRMCGLKRSESCSMHASCFSGSRIPSAKTSLDIETPIEPNHPRSAPMAFNRMSSEELRLPKQWYDDNGKTKLEMSPLLRRDKSTITRHAVKRTQQKRDGRPRALTESEVDALESLLVKMIKNVNYPVNQYLVCACCLGALKWRGEMREELSWKRSRGRHGSQLVTMSYCSLSASWLGTVRDRVGTGLGTVGKIGGTVGTARWGF